MKTLSPKNAWYNAFQIFKQQGEEKATLYLIWEGKYVSSWILDNDIRLNWNGFHTWCDILEIINGDKKLKDFFTPKDFTPKTWSNGK